LRQTRLDQLQEGGGRVRFGHCAGHANSAMLAAQRIVGKRRASHIIIGLPGKAGGRRCARLREQR
jgi:hypothetical protein